MDVGSECDLLSLPADCALGQGTYARKLKIGQGFADITLCYPQFDASLLETLCKGLQLSRNERTVQKNKRLVMVSLEGGIQETNAKPGHIIQKVTRDLDAYLPWVGIHILHWNRSGVMMGVVMTNGRVRGHHGGGVGVHAHGGQLRVMIHA